MVIKDSSFIAAAAIMELATAISGINLAPEDLEQLLVGDYVRVISDLYRFVVTGLAGTDLFV